MRVFCTVFFLLMAEAACFAQGQQPQQSHPSSCPPDKIACATTEGPTYQQTADWIVATLSNVAGGTDGQIQITYDHISMDGCRLTFEEEDDTGGDYRSFFSYVVPMAEAIRVDSSYLKDTHFVTLATSTTAIAQQHWDNRTNGVHEENFNDAQVFVGKPGIDFQEYTTRLQKAFVHAAALCRAQAAQQKPNEPF